VIGHLRKAPMAKLPFSKRGFTDIFGGEVVLSR